MTIKKLNTSLFIIALIIFQTNLYSQNNDIIEGIQIINLVRGNIGVEPIEINDELSDYAVKKAQQQVEALNGEIIISKDEVGLLWVKAEGLGTNYELQEMRFASAALSLVDIDCDEEDKYDMYNQIVDEKSSQVGIGEYLKNGKHCIVFVFDNYVYNQEKD